MLPKEFTNQALARIWEMKSTVTLRATWMRVLPLIVLLCVSGPGTPGDTPPASAPLEGRLFDGADGFAERPLAEAHIFAVSAKEKAVLGHTMTSKEPGPDKGTWQLNNLPEEGEIVLIGFHEKAKDNLWIQRYTLTGKYNDLSIVSASKADKTFTADPSMKALWSELRRVGWVKQEATAKSANACAVELADALLAAVSKKAAKSSQTGP